ncbi:histone H3-trimethyl-L-lysine(9) demethylase [Parastagonospora nodorum]|nr:histone H3-trimethyl-L-lysine(9) demethylase [Parastagonospora nodorum]KAH4393236.1 histone H3-trimethyl-L-lysine(9) demethylase [Parastagonospora nodorum]KAH4536617.1 histone H3-trimethyl-L-lysine(9) demethylase [Parastagonospora nodorum]KAH4596232.1 histone H3-trimethyl-L-lysine(9) demethylase [Parastagonospora nodorum]KAH4733887.1 histone H3-trimethyl-L-lysine(9) demethylase [Parastagonospora nodorum]
MEAPADVVPSVEAPPSHNDDAVPKAALTPPTSEDNDKRDERLSSELSDIDSDDGEDIEPDHYFEGGKIPVFKPTMDQFRNFKRFIDKIDKHGMKSGIVKVIPPTEWRGSLPDLSEAVKSIKVKNPIMQEFAGQHGIYTQANIEKQRSYNLPEWRSVTDEPHHQPPAKRGERRKAAAEPPSRTRSTRAQAAPTNKDTSPAPKRGPGRPSRRRQVKKEQLEDDDDDDDDAASIDVPPTPTSPGKEEKRSTRRVKKENRDDATPTKARGRQPKTADQAKSVSSRRLNNRGAVNDYVDEAAFDDFDYHHPGLEEFTVERCKELEDNYWKTINYGQPMYGADMPGSLFDERTTSWNVAKLPNLLDVLGTKVPGVNTAYLYLGMWKATFAWHLEDVDLYSINYIHFGAPKQWYSISQEDARRFEAAMKSIWPNDAKHCSQFLRHKTYLISPQRLEKDFNIKVNRLVHYEGEFVITYPYGYHSGYNIGYNCAESVNFANESWLSYGRIAKKCNCESDSVWVDVNEIERKLRGEPTPEYYEETDDEDEEEVDDRLPTPPRSVAGKPKAKPGRKPAANKRKRGAKEPEEAPKPKKVRRIRIRIKIPGRGMPCILCPNDVEYDELLPTDNGMKAHRICADYTPETFIIAKPEGGDTVCNVANIGKDRLDLKCNYCRSKRGAVFQCSQKKCTRAFHATCAVAAGVQVDLGPMPTFDEEGTEYFYDGYDFRCRFHRPKKRNNKTVDVDALEKDKFVLNYGKTLKPRDVIQFQYVGGEMYQIYGAQVVENRPGEQAVLVDVLPDGDRVEVEWKYILKLHPDESQRPKPSANAKPLPEHLKESDASLDITNRTDGVPDMGDPFHDPASAHKWAEWHTAPDVTRQLAKVDFSKENRLWYYLGKPSTEARPQYTEDPAKPKNNPKSNFLDTVKPPPPPVPAFAQRPYSAAYPLKPAPIAVPPRTPSQHQLQPAGRPYQYRPKHESYMTSWKSPVYNPDTRKNPNSPVAHQPNVSYDHRPPSQGHGPTQHQGYHNHRPLPPAAQQQQQYQYHPYIPPQAHSTTNWKATPAASGPMLHGINQYAHTSQSKALPPSPYAAGPASGIPGQLPPYPWSQGASQNARPEHSPTMYNAVGQAPSSRASISQIPSNPSGTPNPPNPGGGFTEAWMPQVPTPSTPDAIAPRPTPQPQYEGQQPPPGPPASRPTAQFQSSDAFQRDMQRTSQPSEGAPKWEQMLKQLATSTGPTTTTSTSTAGPTYAPQPYYAQPPSHSSPYANPPTMQPAQGHPPPQAQPHELQRPIPSPISDDGKGVDGVPSAQKKSALPPLQAAPPLHGAETWRYS